VKYQFFTGWSLGVTVPFYLSAGLGDQRGRRRVVQAGARGPLLDRNDVDPYSLRRHGSD